MLAYIQNKKSNKYLIKETFFKPKKIFDHLINVNVIVRFSNLSKIIILLPFGGGGGVHSSYSQTKKVHNKIACNFFTHPTKLYKIL